MPHLHLSLQSGDDMILKRMKRRHSRADAIRFTETVRRLRPDVVFGADLIAGFPTENEAMFENSLRYRRGMRAHPPPRLSLLAAPRHAGGAHAAARPRPWSRSAPRVSAHAGEAALAGASRRRAGRLATDPGRARRVRPHRAFHARRDSTCGAGRDRRRRASPATPPARSIATTRRPDGRSRGGLLRRCPRRRSRIDARLPTKRAAIRPTRRRRLPAAAPVARAPQGRPVALVERAQREHQPRSSPSARSTPQSWTSSRMP